MQKLQPSSSDQSKFHKLQVERLAQRVQDLASEKERAQQLEADLKKSKALHDTTMKETLAGHEQALEEALASNQKALKEARVAHEQAVQVTAWLLVLAPSHCSLPEA